MPYRHGYTTTLSIGRNERDVSVTFTVTPGWCGDREDPGYPAEVQIVAAAVCVETDQPFGRPTIKTWEPAPAWLVAILENDPDIVSDMLAEAGEDEADRRAA